MMKLFIIRLKSFLKIFKILCVLLISGLLLVTIIGCQASSKPTGEEKPAEEEKLDAISIGTSSVGSVFYTLSVGMADIITKNTYISANAEPVGGSDATIRAIAENKVEMGMVNSSSAVNAYLGQGQFKEEGSIPIQLVAQGQDSLRQLVVRKDANINTPADLAGKNIIARRRALPEIEMFMEAILEVYGIAKDQVNILETAETKEAIEALTLGTVHGAIIPAGVGASFLIELSESTDVKFISIPDDKLALILAKLGPAFRKGTIPANTYRGQNEDIFTPSMPALLVARSDIPEETVYQVVKAILEDTERMKAIHPDGGKWTVENTLENFPLPFHPGSIKYFKEIKAWNEELENRQKKLSQLKEKV